MARRQDFGFHRSALLGTTALVAAAVSLAAAPAGAQVFPFPSGNPIAEDQSGTNGENGYSAFSEFDSDENHPPTSGTDGGGITVDVTDPVSGDRGVAISLTTNGGSGGAAYEARSYLFKSDPPPVDGGNGGSGGDVSLTVSDNVTSEGTPIEALVQIQTNGGKGGAGESFAELADGTDLSAGGYGGDGGDVTLNITGPAGPGGSTGQTVIGTAPGAELESPGGSSIQANGADGGSASGDANTYPSIGGEGGDGGTVNVRINNALVRSVARQPTAALSISADAGNGGTGGSQQNTFYQSMGGNSGSGGTVGIFIGVKGGVEAAAGGVVGILAEANGGTGGAAGGDGSNGIGGASMGAGNVTVTNLGDVSTYGAASYGVVAQAFGGNGAPGTPSYGFFFAEGNTGGSGGDGGNLKVRLGRTGTVTTDGTGATAVLAQSIAGGGGNAGESVGAVAIGGDGGDEGDGGNVNVTNAGKISATGEGAHGIVALSTAGGGGVALGSLTIQAADESGGDGGDTTSMFFGHGGTAGSGGNGGGVYVSQTGTVATDGSNSHAIVAHSIAGGGGVAGGTYSGAPFVTVGIGGKGGEGGAGGTVRVNTGIKSAPDAPQGTITTNGPGSLGIHAASIGGGGGDGGGSWALAAGIPAESINAGASITIGGDGGQGGVGGNVFVSNVSSITTLDADSLGIYAHSIGGGGGVGGAATSYAVVPDVGTASVAGLAAAIAVGGDAADGAVAGTVRLKNWASVTTIGDQSTALKAHSVGGGGGHGGNAHANAATYGVGGGFNASVSVAVGGTGGKGGDGNTVFVTNTADLSTVGARSHGIDGKSVGGGGGSGGAGSTYSVPGVLIGGKSNTATVSVGGSGGASGDGKAVSIQNASSISTGGKDSKGILAQSVGGGGGEGGGAQSNAAANNISIGVDVGASGGATGDGGRVAVRNFAAGDISTTAHGSMGIMAQSIGGGGGDGGTATATNDLPSFLNGVRTATSVYYYYNKFFNSQMINKLNSDGTTGTKRAKHVFVNVTVGGKGGSAGDGGWVIVNNAGNISTQGDAAAAIYAHSVGGGGGVAGTASAGGELKQVNVIVGTSGGDGGDGGKVTVANTGTIATQGNYSVGVMGQSVGGGGGTGGQSGNLVPFRPSQETGRPAGPTSSGWVDVTLNGGAITTSGTGASGVVAQAIAGGGGHLVGNTVLGAPTNPYIYNGDDFFAGAVVVQSSRAKPPSITTTGVGAHGIFAQSSAGWGGSVGSFAGMATTMNPDVPTLADVVQPTATQGILIDYSGDISATGLNSVAIYAEASQISSDSQAGDFSQDDVLDLAAKELETSIATGSGESPGTGGNGAIQIAVDGTITGGSGTSGAGIAIVGGRGNTIDIQGGTVSAGTDGFAIAATLPLDLGDIDLSGAVPFPDDPTPVQDSFTYNTLVTNQGTVVGNVDLGTGRNRFFNAGTFYPGDIVTISGDRSWGTIFEKVLVGQETVSQGSTADTTDGSFVNTGTINVAGPGVIGSSTFTTDTFQQTAGGTLAVDVNLPEGEADHLTVTGDAQLSGTVAPRVVGLSSGVPGTSETLEFLSATSVTVNGLTVQNTLATQFKLIADATSLSLQTEINLSGVQTGTDAAGEVAQHLDGLIQSGKTGDLESTIVNLANSPTGSGDAYTKTLTDMSGGQSVYANAFGSAAKLRGTQDQLHSCHVFAGDGALVSEESCMYVRGIGGYGEGSSGWSGRGFSTSWGAAAFGGQARVSDNLFLGGLISAGQSSTSADDDSYTSDSDDVSVGAVMKYLPTPRTELSFSATYTRSKIDQSRYVGSAVAQANYDTGTLGLRGKLAHQYDRGSHYIEPSVQLDAGNVDIPAYNETGAGALDLFYSSVNDWRVGFTPSVEVGRRIDRGDSVLRAFATGGVTLWNKNDVSQTVSFRGALPGSGFSSTAEGTDWTVNLGVGAELVQDNGLAFEARYNLRTDGDFNDHRLSARVRWRF